MNQHLIVFALLNVCLIAARAEAHKPSDSYLRIDTSSDIVRLEWDIALSDLELVVGLDANGDGQITWREVRAQQQTIVGHAISRLQLSDHSGPCELQLTEMLATRHSDGGYAVLRLQGTSAAEQPLSLNYSLLFDLDPTHRGLVLHESGAGVTTHVLTLDRRSIELDHGAVGLWQTLVVYVREGMWHIWIGVDHILFLLALLIPAVLTRSQQQWAPVDNLRPALWDVLKIVSMFTLAHSLTLWLAVMGYATPPSRVVESAIALSIVVTAVNNLMPVLPLSNWMLAFLFGLVHGFGFANVLLDLGLSSTGLGVALFGFNVGVELGQMAIVVAFMPLAFALRSTLFYRYAVLQAGSVLVAMVACVWFYERAFNASILAGLTV